MLARNFLLAPDACCCRPACPLQSAAAEPKKKTKKTAAKKVFVNKTPPGEKKGEAVCSEAATHHARAMPLPAAPLQT